jgi:hypothetical protein
VLSWKEREAHQWELQTQASYLYFESKRRRLAEIEIDTLRKLVAVRALGKTFALEDFEEFHQGGADARRQFEESWLQMNSNASRDGAVLIRKIASALWRLRVHFSRARSDEF